MSTTSSFHIVGSAAVKRVNEELVSGTEAGLLSALRDPSLNIDPEMLSSYNVPLYWEEMVADRNYCGHELTLKVQIFDCGNKSST